MTAADTTDAPISWRFALSHAGFIVAVSLAGPLTALVAVALALWAFTTPLAGLQALSLVVIVRGMNAGLVAGNVVASTAWQVLPLLLGLRFLLLTNATTLRVLLPLAVFVLVSAAFSLVTSPALDVSLMKALSLALVAGGVLSACLALPARDLRAFSCWLRTLAVVAAALSLATLVAPGIAFMPATRLLRGIFNQSQYLGPFLAPFAAALLAQWLFTRGKATPLATASLTLILVCTLLTRSRTAAVATLIGVAFGMWGGSRRDPTRRADSGKAIVAITGLAVVLLVLELAGVGVSDSITSFAHKGSTQELEEGFRASRGNLISVRWQNFLTSPLIGHGFGVYPDGVFPTGVTRLFGIPLSAPTEKGFLPVAVLEETGVLGFACFAWLVLSLAARLWRSATHAVMAMFIACLFINVGEATLLSPGGLGLHLWLLIGWCLRTAQLDATPAALDFTASGTVSASLRDRRRHPFPNLLD